MQYQTPTWIEAVESLEKSNQELNLELKQCTDYNDRRVLISCIQNNNKLLAALYRGK